MVIERSTTERNDVPNDGTREDEPIPDAHSDPRSRGGRPVTRRRWLGVCGALSATTLAGCTGGGETDGGPADGGADGDGTDEDDDGAADDDEADGGSGDETDEGDDAAENDDGSSRFGDVIRFTEEFAFEWESTDESTGTVRGSGRFHGENMYWQAEEEDGSEWEMYVVDGDMYVIEGDECFRMPQQEQEDDREEVDTEIHEREASENPDLEPVGTDTIDGETVLVFELSRDEAATHDEEITYYVSAETGYLRRVETATDVIDYHSWGDVEPIEAPDVECVTMGGEDEGDYPSVASPP